MPITLMFSCCSAVTFRELLILLEPVPQLWAVHGRNLSLLSPVLGEGQSPSLSHGQDALLGSAGRFGHGLWFPGSFPEYHQPESRWKTGLEPIQLDRCICYVQCWMQSWCFLWLLGGDSDRNCGSLSPKSSLSGPKGYCTSRLWMSSCFFWTTPVLFTVFSVKCSFPFGPFTFSL